jgi:hydrogenase maturation protease
MNGNVVIMGIGNWLLSDDGIGVHAAQALAEAPPPGALVVDAGTDILSALSFFPAAGRVLLIDAVQGGESPGAIRLYEESDLIRHGTLTTSHTLHVLASRPFLPPGTAWPAIRILGVEPASLAYGMTLSPAVAAALPHVTRLCREIVNAWTSDSTPP